MHSEASLGLAPVPKALLGALAYFSATLLTYVFASCGVGNESKLFFKVTLILFISCGLSLGAVFMGFAWMELVGKMLGVIGVSFFLIGFVMFATGSMEDDLRK
jgi:hypothetical protein